MFLAFSCHGARPIETFDIDLDLPPKDRWTKVALKYEAEALQVMNALLDLIPDRVQKEVIWAADAVEHFWPHDLDLRQEMEGVAKLVGVPVGIVLLANLSYEFNVGCTSIVAKHANGTMFLGHNLDYHIPFLEKIVINVRFVKNSRVEYQGTTFVGYIGLLTGMRSGSFALSINERSRAGSLWDNLVETILYGGRSIGFFSRSLLASAVDYDQALESFTTTPLISPVYIILSGVQDKGAVVSRDRNKAVDVWAIEEEKESWFLVETNYDHWLPARDDRREATKEHLRKTGDSKTLSLTTLSTVLEMPPTLNRNTIFTAVMSAETGAYISTLQQQDRSLPPLSFTQSL